MPAVCVITAVEMATHWPPSSKARQGVQLVCGLGGGVGWERLLLQARGSCIALNIAKLLVTQCFMGEKRQVRAVWAVACAGKVKKYSGRGKLTLDLCLKCLHHQDKMPPSPE